MRIQFNPQILHRAAQYTPGTFSFDDGGKGWVYVQAQNFVHVHRAARLDTPSFAVERISSSNDRTGDRVCIAESEFATGDWGWMQVYGFGILDVQGQTNANQVMRTAGSSPSREAPRRKHRRDCAGDNARCGAIQFGARSRLLQLPHRHAIGG